ncbi:helix-turn-helix domain-containing protein [Paenibacillus oenotherae]|uniref:Helix-turn-helix domain-containing protein n=1 Tax=Paenibacillus oenotherae TaxID=1435645 RepID=A0ABS7DBG9_9BACL|nr:helix-turn-helix transcriptional regulator [Paenibacillus oenotherae]MBW7477235.1 helix-turn-helix domain-containing protein [Paenibacillus oenotherae]
MDIQIDFGKRVKELRTKNGFSQEILAARAGLDRSYIGGIERGERNVSLRNIQRLAVALNTTIPCLFSEIEARIVVHVQPFL